MTPTTLRLEDAVTLAGHSCRVKGVVRLRNTEGVEATRYLLEGEHAAPQVVEAQPQVVEVQPQATVPQTGGSVVMIPRTDARVTGYWVCSGGRWWYYPMPAGATSGTRLAPDLSVTGGPPGYGASACAAGQSVAVSGVPQVQPPPPPVQPYGQPPQYYSVDPYGRAVVVRPGVIIAPYGSGGVRIEWGTRPRPYGRVRGRWR